MKKVTKQQNLFDLLEAIETAEKPYVSAAGFPLPWEEKEAVRQANRSYHSLSYLPPIDALQKRGKVKTENRLTTTSVEDRARALSFFDGKSYAIKKWQDAQDKQSRSFKQRESRCQERGD